MAERTVMVRGREFTITATGGKHICYTLTSGRMVRKGLRNVPNPDLIIVVDNAGNRCGAFLDSTGAEVVF
jgi:hypothetical protein